MQTSSFMIHRILPHLIRQDESLSKKCSKDRLEEPGRDTQTRGAYTGRVTCLSEPQRLRHEGKWKEERESKKRG